MPIATIPLTSFTGGEWSPRLHGRVDIAKYQSSCEVLQNMIIYPHGGITRRMGMEYIENAKASGVRLVPFEYNREQAYVLEFTNTTIRFFRNGAQIESSPGVPYEIVSPYTTAQLADLSFTQSADTMYLVHEAHAPYKLTRPGPDTFALAAVTFTGAPADWSAPNGYPRAVTFFQNRLVFAGSPKFPQKFWMSKTFDFEVLTPGTAGSDGLTFTLSSNQVNAIQWLVAGKQLFVGTTGGEWTIFGSGDAALTPSNVQARRESNFGSKNGRVQLVGTGVFYASRDGKKLREMNYSFESDGYLSPELSLLSEHLTRTGIKEFDFAQNPDGILWVVFNDGTFAGFTYLKSQEVQGWHRHETDGTVLSVCTIESDEGSEIWFAVNRNGAVRIERMKEAFEGTAANDIDCAYLDSYLSYNGTPVSTISGLGHLEGKTIDILADGQYIRGKVVSSGSVSLGISASKIIAGLPYTSRLVPLRPEGGSEFGFSQGKRKKVESIVVRLERSSGVEYGTPGFEDSFCPVPARTFGENFNAAIELFTGDIPIRLPPKWDRDGKFELRTSSPFPLTILMIAVKVQVNE